MPDLEAVLADLIASHKLRLRDDAFLRSQPAAGSRPWTCVEGMMLGLAIGDSLGNGTESMNPARRMKRPGEIRDFLPNPWAGGQKQGVPSDDTQMSAWTLEQLLADGELVPEHLAQRFAADRLFGINPVTRESITRLAEGLPWDEAGTRAAGNGAVMRMAPLLIPHLRAPSPRLWADVALGAMITHNDGASNAASVALAALLWDLLAMRGVPEPSWWRLRFTEVSGALEPADERYRAQVPKYAGYEGRFTDYLAARLDDAAQRKLSSRHAAEEWASGAYLLECMPCALHILSLHGHEPEQAMLHAVNDTRDNDTIGAIVGACVGALHGADALPVRWRRGLLGRTAAADDGRYFELLTAAKEKFGA